MKYKLLVFSAVLLITFTFACQVFAQTLIPKYSKLGADNPFIGYSPPIGLAILRFNGDALLDIRQFNLLKQDTSVLKRFTIFPYNVLQAQMNVLGLVSLDPNDRRTLNQLREQLNINLVVTGRPLPNGFEMRILSTNGFTPYVHTFLNTSHSTALNDAARLFRENIQTDYINIGNIEWVPVDSGTFQMGSNNGYGDERPVHTVSVKSFYMSTTEVTFDQYDAFCDATGRDKPDDKGWGRGSMPIFAVSWDDANAYCKWLSDQTGETVRLPTEAELEFAARGGNISRGTKFSGSDNIEDVAWFGGNSKGKPHEVGGRMPNELGIYDLSGNVWEWCQDWYHSSYDGAPTDGSAWNIEDPQTPYHVVRCGAYDCSADNCRVTVRNAGNAAGWVNFAGFRLVKGTK